MAQLVKCPTLDFGSGVDLTVGAFDPRVGLSAINMEPILDPLCLSVCPSPALALSLSLSLSKIKINI